MNPFEFFIPQNITVGAGTLAKLPECAKKLGGSHAMLISGPTLRKMGVVDKAADYLKDAGMAVDIFTDVEANPSVTTVEKATEAYKESGADFIVALGGGSPMDVAKAVGVTAKYGGSITEYEGAHKVPGKIVLNFIFRTPSQITFSESRHPQNSFFPFPSEQTVQNFILTH